MAKPKSTRKTIPITLEGSLGSDAFEQGILAIQEARLAKSLFRFDLSGARFAPVDVLVAFLFLLNDLVAEGHGVELHWGASPVSGYADRIGFFGLLDKSISVSSESADGALYNSYKDNNPTILEMTEVPEGTDREAANAALQRIEERLTENLAPARNEETRNDIWTFATEALDNIYEHSKTPRPGVVAAQPYASAGRGRRLSLVIADAGLGIPATIRAGNRRADSMTDRDIILAAFREGLSRRSEKGHGCGLTRCAQVAARHQGNLRVRAGRVSAKLVTRSARMGMTISFFNDEAVSISGTQIVLDLYLDRLGAGV